MLPPCPSCRALLSTDRLIDQGRAELWYALISCGACLAIAHLAWTDSLGTPTVTLRAAGPVVARMRDALIAARERGDAESEVRRVMEDPERAWLLAAPEVVGEAVGALGKAWRLSKNATIRAPWYVIDDDIPRPLHLLSRAPEHLQKEDIARAIRGSELGGFIIPKRSATNGRVIILAAQRLQLAGIRGKHLVFDIPAFARKHIDWVTTVVDEEGLVLPDRVRRPV